MRLAMIENLAQAEPYCHQKGIFPAREAVVMQQQDRGIEGVSADEVFIGNGVSELIDLALETVAMYHTPKAAEPTGQGIRLINLNVLCYYGNRLKCLPTEASS